MSVRAETATIYGAGGIVLRQRHQGPSIMAVTALNRREHD